MASKTSRPAAGRTGAAAAATSTPSTALAEGAGFMFAQGQLQTLIALADVMFKSVEECRRCQLDAAQEARRRHGRAQADVASAGSANELLNVQAALLRYDMEAGSRYWQQLAAIGASMQAEAVNLITKNAATFGGDVTRLASQLPASVKPVATEAVKTELDPAQGWTRWMDLSKQWSDMLYRNEAALH